MEATAQTDVGAPGGLLRSRMVGRQHLKEGDDNNNNNDMLWLLWLLQQEEEEDEDTSHISCLHHQKVLDEKQRGDIVEMLRAHAAPS